jgi:Membrane proteins related to metalloendopeptidases
MDWFVKIVAIGVLWFILSSLMTIFQGRYAARIINLPTILLVIVITLQHAGPALARVGDHYNEVRQDVHGLTDAINSVGNTRNKINEISGNIGNSPITNFGSNPKIPAKTITEIFSGGHLEWPATGKITQSFAPPDHHGIDIAVPVGTSIKSSRNGWVREAGMDPSGVYGNYILIDHGGGWQTLYAHCSELKTKSGKNVFSKDVIALSGDTGNSTGPHLHFEVRFGGKALDPMAYLKK